MKTNRTYNTVVFSDNIEFLNEVVSRCPYECVKLGEGRYGFMDNKNGDIRDYFCDTLGYTLGQEGFDFEYLDEQEAAKTGNDDDIEISYTLKGSKEIEGSVTYIPGNEMFLALTLSKSKMFKTLKGARSFMARHGYVEYKECTAKKDRYTKEVDGMRVEAYFINEKTPLEELKESGDKKNIREMIEAKERALANAMENVEYYTSVGNKEFADNEQTRVNRLNKDLANLRASLELPAANDTPESPNTSYGTSEISRIYTME